MIHNWRKRFREPRSKAPTSRGMSIHQVIYDEVNIDEQEERKARQERWKSAQEDTQPIRPCDWGREEVEDTDDDQL